MSSTLTTPTSVKTENKRINKMVTGIIETALTAETKKAAKKKWLDNLKSSMKEGTILVDTKNSRATFYTVVKVHLTKQNKAKAVDVVYTDSAEGYTYSSSDVTPGLARLNDDRWLYQNCSITSRGVVIEKRYSGGTWDTVGKLYDANDTYSYDDCA